MWCWRRTRANWRRFARATPTGPSLVVVLPLADSLLPQRARAELVAALRMVDYVVTADDTARGCTACFARTSATGAPGRGPRGPQTAVDGACSTPANQLAAASWWCGSAPWATSFTPCPRWPGSSRVIPARTSPGWWNRAGRRCSKTIRMWTAWCCCTARTSPAWWKHAANCAPRITISRWIFRDC